MKILYASADTTRRRVSPLGLQRLYAIRAPGTRYDWQLGTALPRLTSGWVQRREGAITFWYAPDITPDTARAARAARFVTEVARRFEVAPPERLDYYVTSSPDEYHRIVGLDYFLRPSGPGTATGGMALGDGIVLAGDPAQGEAYLHELVHSVLRPIEIRNHFVSEGIATWLGGSQGRTLPELAAVLGAFQRERPDVALDQLVGHEVPNGGQAATMAWYATAALFVEAVHRRAGMRGVRALTAAPGGADATRRLLHDALGGSAGAGDWWSGLAARARPAGGE